MHSHETRAGRTYHHNGDFSGEVKIVVAPAEVEHAGGGVLVRVPFEDLKDIVAEYVRGRLVERLEDADSDEVLGSASPREIMLDRSMRERARRVTELGKVASVVRRVRPREGLGGDEDKGRPRTPDDISFMHGPPEKP